MVRRPDHQPSAAGGVGIMVAPTAPQPVAKEAEADQDEAPQNAPGQRGDEGEGTAAEDEDMEPPPEGDATEPTEGDQDL